VVGAGVEGGGDEGGGAVTVGVDVAVTVGVDVAVGLGVGVVVGRGGLVPTHLTWHFLYVPTSGSPQNSLVQGTVPVTRFWTQVEPEP
jgi:hypothetical protein